MSGAVAGRTAIACLVGAGFFARNHLEGWRELERAGVRLAAVCDRDGARAAAVAAEFGAEPFDDPAAMLDAVRPDLVDVATPSSSHRALVELAAPRARLVICQKPLADDLEDARVMVAACEATGSTLLVHENFRWQRGFRRIRELIADGAIGTPRFARIAFRHGHDVYAGQPYLASAPRLAIMDVGAHLFDLARLFLGEAEAVTCETQRRDPRVLGEDAFSALVAHAGGGVSVVDASFASRLSPEPFPQTLATIEGDDGTLELREGYLLSVHGAQGRRDEDVEPPVPAWGERPWHGVQDSVLALQAHALGVLAGEEEAQPSGADNLRTLALCLAAYGSAETGRRVSL